MSSPCVGKKHIRFDEDDDSDDDDEDKVETSHSKKLDTSATNGKKQATENESESETSSDDDDDDDDDCQIIEEEATARTFNVVLRKNARAADESYGFQLKGHVDQKGCHWLSDVAPGSAASRARLLNGDKIVRVNGRDVSTLDINELIQLIEQERAHNASKLSLTVERSCAPRKHKRFICKMSNNNMWFLPFKLNENINCNTKQINKRTKSK